ncbi:10462_t:CDS:2, partial [Entrophospora sp. SA101]
MINGEIANEPTSNDILEELVDGLRKVNINCTNNLTMSAEDFVNIDSRVIMTELPTDEDIVEDILISEGVHVEEEDVSEESEEESVMSIKEGRKVLENAKKFLEQQEFATEKDIKYVKELIKRLNSFEDKTKYILISEGVHVEDEDVSKESEEESVMSIKEGRKVLGNAKKFLEQQEFATEKDI